MICFGPWVSLQNSATDVPGSMEESEAVFTPSESDPTSERTASPLLEDATAETLPVKEVSQENTELSQSLWKSEPSQTLKNRECCPIVQTLELSI